MSIPISRATVVSLCDICLAAVAWFLSYLLRFNFSIPPEFMHSFVSTLPWVVAAQAFVFRLFGLYQASGVSPACRICNSWCGPLRRLRCARRLSC